MHRQFPNQLVDASLPAATDTMDDAAAHDTAVDGLDADVAARHALMGGFLHPRQGLAPGLLRGHEDLDLVTCERQAVEILEPPATHGHGRRRGLRDPLVVRAAADMPLRKRIVSTALISHTCFTVWPVFWPRSPRSCSSRSWGRSRRCSIPSWPQGGRRPPRGLQHHEQEVNPWIGLAVVHPE